MPIHNYMIESIQCSVFISVTISRMESMSTHLLVDMMHIMMHSWPSSFLNRSCLGARRRRVSLCISVTGLHSAASDPMRASDACIPNESQSTGRVSNKLYTTTKREYGHWRNAQCHCNTLPVPVEQCVIAIHFQSQLSNVQYTLMTQQCMLLNGSAYGQTLMYVVSD